MTGGVLIVDEAYGEVLLSAECHRADRGIPARLIVSRTMSKAFAFRRRPVGLLLVAPAVIDGSCWCRLPYHLSAITRLPPGRSAARRRDTGFGGCLGAERDRVSAR